MTGMNYEILIAAQGFAFASTLTPGPNNLMLLASGANFGFVRTIPHMLGVGLGVAVMVFLMGIGLIQVFQAFPVVHTILKTFCSAYMIWLAYKIATAAPPQEARAKGKPLTFLQAAAFQWINPKAWAMATTSVTAFAADHTLLAILLVSGTFIVSASVSTTSWTALGQQLRRLLNRPGWLRIFNVTMALLLVATLYPILLA